jgi:hypothetical protein
MNEISDLELEGHYHYWLEHYIANGEKHYDNTPEWKVIELYNDMIVERVLQELPEMNDEENEIIANRLSQLF